MRYAPAIRRYLDALIRNADDAEELTQEFLLRGLLQGFVRTSELRGRFRDYLKAAVRHAALNHLRRKRPVQDGVAGLEQVPAPDDQRSAADQQWVEQWRACVLDRAWQALDDHQRRSPGSLAFTVLRLAADHPEEDSTALAARATASAGRPIRADAFRKQLSRSRRLFAELVVAEVSQTLEQPSRERVVEELVDLGLMSYVGDYLSGE
jgi:hypothetical protein